MAMKLNQVIATSISNGRSAKKHEEEAHAFYMLTGEQVVKTITVSSDWTEARKQFAPQWFKQYAYAAKNAGGLGWTQPKANDDVGKKLQQDQNRMMAKYFTRWVINPAKMYAREHDIEIPEVPKAKSAGESKDHKRFAALRDQLEMAYASKVGDRKQTLAQREELVEFLLKCIKNRAKLNYIIQAGLLKTIDGKLITGNPSQAKQRKAA